MTTFAIVSGGEVVNTIVWDGNVENWQPPEGCIAVEVPEGISVSIGHAYDGSAFTPPPTPPVPPPTAIDVLAQRDALLAYATLRIAPLQDAVDLDDVTTAETAALKSWKQYRVALSRIEQQTGFPSAVVWPSTPT